MTKEQLESSYKDFRTLCRYWGVPPPSRTEYKTFLYLAGITTDIDETAYDITMQAARAYMELISDEVVELE